MKTRWYWLAVAFTAAAGVILSGLFLFSPRDQRSDYEKRMLKEAANFPAIAAEDDRGEEGEEGEPGSDQPDMAAFTEYIKTMDPSTGRVPSEKLPIAFRQTRDAMAFKSSGSLLSWTNRINNAGGRTRVIFNDPNDPGHSKVWAGSVTGGLWYNDDAYSNGEWHPVADFWPGLAVACMTSDPNDPKIFYVGTGESQTAQIIYRESSSRGYGIMRSLDAGQTWELMPSTTDWAYVTDILVRSEGSRSVIYAGVVSGIYKGKLHESGPTDGLYRSTDGGNTWTQVLPLVPGGIRPYAPSDIDLSADGARIFIGTTCHGEDRSGAASILWSDNGTDWQVMDDYYSQLIVSQVWEWNQITYAYPGRVMLAASPSDAGVVYAAITGGFRDQNNFVQYTCRYLLKSTDKGITWQEIPMALPIDNNTFANLAWHAMAITVDPANSSTLWVGGLDVWRSPNSGTDWQKMSFWAPRNQAEFTRFVHADIHSITFRPGAPAELLVGTDGGLFYSGNAQAEIPEFSGRNRSYGTLQYYYGAIHPEAGRNFFMGGLQDNGTIVDAEFDGQPAFGTITGGDGFHCFIDEDEPQYLITTIYYTWLNLYSLPNPQELRGLGGANYRNGTFWNAMDYDWKYNILYANGCSFTGQNANTLRVARISPQGINPPINAPLMNVPSNSAVPYSCIKWYRNSGEEASTIYIGTESGRIFRLTEAMVVGELTELTRDNLPVGSISSIDIASIEDTLLLTYSNYGIPSVFVSIDAGMTWRNVEANLPDMPVRWGIFHPDHPAQVMLATETGVWTTDDVFAPVVVWKPDIQGMANVRVDMLKFRESDHTVLAATHGRGMFTARWDPAFTSGTGGQPVISEGTLSVFPNPSDGWFTVKADVDGSATLTVSDASGRTVAAERIAGAEGKWLKSFNLPGEPAGVYLVRLEFKGMVQVERVVLR